MKGTCALLGRVALALFLLVACPAVAHAQVSCTVTATGMSFGTYDVYSSTPLTSTATITLNCSGTPFSHDLAVTVTLSSGSSGSYLDRTMHNGGPDALHYNLGQDATCNPPWGDTQANGVPFTYPKSQRGNNLPLTVFGRMAALQDVSGGATPYTDRITVTILW